MDNDKGHGSNFFKGHWFGIFLSSVLSGLAASLVYYNFPVHLVISGITHWATTSGPPQASASINHDTMKATSLHVTTDAQGNNGKMHENQSLPVTPARVSTGDVVFDSTTGLMWQDDDYSDTEVRSSYQYWSSQPNGKLQDWKGAIQYCRKLNLDGYDDWRLPSIAELRSAYQIKRRFSHVKPNRYWSSSTAVPDLHWYVQFNSGDSGYNYAPLYTLYVRCVRDSHG